MAEGLGRGRDLRERAGRQALLHGHGGVPIRKHAPAHRAPPHIRDGRRPREVQAHEGLQRHLPDGHTRHRDPRNRHSQEDGGEGRGAHRHSQDVRRGRRGHGQDDRPRLHNRLFRQGARGRHARRRLQHGLAPEVRLHGAFLQQVHRMAVRHTQREGLPDQGEAPGRLVPQGRQRRGNARHEARCRARDRGAGGGEVRRRGRGREDGLRDLQARDDLRRDEPLRQGGRSLRPVRGRRREVLPRQGCRGRAGQSARYKDNKGGERAGAAREDLQEPAERRVPSRPARLLRQGGPGHGRRHERAGARALRLRGHTAAQGERL